MPRHAAGSLVALVVTLALSLLRPAPAASGADWETRVGAYPITCSVSNLGTDSIGSWTSFTLTYSFCDGNFWKLDCTSRSRGTGSLVGDVECEHRGGPAEQECRGAVYRMKSVARTGYTFPLIDGTLNAQRYVCEAQFNLMRERGRLTVDPLK